jgi:hypothetical protein
VLPIEQIGLRDEVSRTRKRRGLRGLLSFGAGEEVLSLAELLALRAASGDPMGRQYQSGATPQSECETRAKP